MKTLGPIQKTIVGAQFLFVAFGATVLVPLLIGLDPSVALLTARVGTLIFHAVTKGKVPIFLGSSFVFIAPVIKATELYGLPGALFGIIGVGLVYGIISLLIRLRGVGFITRLFPPVVVGPVIMLIGLSLAGTGCRRIAFWKRNISPDSYLFRNYSRIHCFNMLRPCGFSACLGCKMVRSSSVRAS